eukprot:2588968-Rhodomonas_salina.3
MKRSSSRIQLAALVWCEHKSNMRRILDSVFSGVSSRVNRASIILSKTSVRFACLSASSLRLSAHDSVHISPGIGVASATPSNWFSKSFSSRVAISSFAPANCTTIAVVNAAAWSSHVPLPLTYSSGSW